MCLTTFKNKYFWEWLLENTSSLLSETGFSYEASKEPLTSYRQGHLELGGVKEAVTQELLQAMYTMNQLLIFFDDRTQVEADKENPNVDKTRKALQPLKNLLSRLPRREEWLR